MTFHSFIQTTRPLLQSYILSFLQKKKNLSTLYFYNDLLERLCQFIPQGKMLRGLFVLLIAHLYKDTILDHIQDSEKKDPLLAAAGAMEIIQSAFLIHDDMMDKDRIRRGSPTIFAQYEDHARTANISEPYHYGQSMGLCVGDLAFFLAFELISNLPSSSHRTQLIHTFIQEVQMVSAAQMTDMHYGLSSDEPTTDEIRTMYLHKTARYSFSLPFSLGALLSAAPKEDIEHLRLIGEYIGIAFQIKDDEIKMMGSEKEVGTDIGSDIRENKKTLIRAWLLEKANNKDKQKLLGLFGNKEITEKDITYVQSCLHTYGILAYIQEETEQLTKKAHTLIEKLHLEKKGTQRLKDMIAYVVSRKR